MQNEVKNETGGISRPLVLTIIVLLVAAAAIYAAVQERSQKNKRAQESVPVSTDTGNAQVTVALPGLEPEKPEVDSSSKEIVGDVLLSNVPKADFSYSFNGRLNDAV
ncbi:MAG: hypothetical protein K2O15_02375, partial [Lachnospiraceae bacterium]|nr:hypothetical protein [Lachnospiraceae bacterium]